MLAFVVAVALAQCSKDTDCKGDRICVDGQCVGDAPKAAPAQVPQPVVIVPDRATSLARIYQLRNEISDLHTELEDATLGGPVFKLIGGGLLGALSGASFVLTANALECESRNLRYCGNPAAWVGVAVPSAVLAVVLFIWGGLQLRNRLETQSRIPGEIAIREAELRELEAARMR